MNIKKSTTYKNIAILGIFCMLHICSTSLAMVTYQYNKEEKHQSHKPLQLTTISYDTLKFIELKHSDPIYPQSYAAYSENIHNSPLGEQKALNQIVNSTQLSNSERIIHDQLTLNNLIEKNDTIPLKNTINLLNTLLYNDEGKFIGLNNTQHQLNASNITADYIGNISKDQQSFETTLEYLCTLHPHFQEIVANAISQYENQEKNRCLNEIPTSLTQHPFNDNLITIIEHCQKGNYNLAKMIGSMYKEHDQKLINTIINIPGEERQHVYCDTLNSNKKYEFTPLAYKVEEKHSWTFPRRGDWLGFEDIQYEKQYYSTPLSSDLEKNIAVNLGIYRPIITHENLDDKKLQNNKLHFGTRPIPESGKITQRGNDFEERIKKFQQIREQKVHDWQQLRIEHQNEPLKHTIFQKKIEKVEKTLTLVCQNSTNKEVIEKQVIGLLDLADTSFGVPSLDKPLQVTVNRILNQLYDRDGGFIGITDQKTLNSVTHLVFLYLKDHSYNAFTLDVADALGAQVNDEDKKWLHNRLHKLVDSGLPFQEALEAEHGKQGLLSNMKNTMKLISDNFSYEPDILSKIYNNPYTAHLITALTAKDSKLAESAVDDYTKVNDPRFFKGKTQKVAEQRVYYLRKAAEGRKQELAQLNQLPKQKNQNLQEYLMQEYEKLALAKNNQYGDEIFQELADRCHSTELSPHEIRDACEVFLLDANRFHETTSQECNQAKYDLALTLKELSSNNLEPGEKLVVTQMADTTLKLVEANQPAVAQTVLDGLNATAEFLMGATGEFIKIRALQAATTYGLQLAASSPLITSILPAVPASPLIVPAITIGYAAYHIYNNVNEIIDAADKAPKMWEKGQYRDLGELSTDVFFTAASFKSIVDIYKRHKALPTLKEGMKAGAKAAKQIEHLEKHSQELYTKVKETKFYAQAVKKAMESGSSKQAIEQNVQNACKYFSCPEQVEKFLEEIQKCAKYQGVVTPKGLEKPLRYNLYHIFLFEEKRGKLLGGHSDFGHELQKAGKLKFQGLENGPDGIYRAFITYGNTPGKESSFFPASMRPAEICDMLNKILAKEDFSKDIGKEIGGKVWKKIPVGKGWGIGLYVNPKTGDVNTFYTYCDKWVVPLQKKLFTKK